MSQKFREPRLHGWRGVLYVSRRILGQQFVRDCRRSGNKDDDLERDAEPTVRLPLANSADQDRGSKADCNRVN
jgi:hypothetical protein